MIIDVDKIELTDVEGYFVPEKAYIKETVDEEYYDYYYVEIHGRWYMPENYIEENRSELKFEGFEIKSDDKGKYAEAILSYDLDLRKICLEAIQIPINLSQVLQYILDYTEFVEPIGGLKL